MSANKEHIYQIGSKELRINKSSISWTNKLLNNIIHEPTEIRYGTAPIEIDMFTIGTKYRIDLRDDDGNTFMVSIKSYFGIGRDKKFNQYQEIADLLWDYFFAERFGLVVSEWEEGKTQRIGKFEIDLTSLTRKVSWNGSRGITMSFEEMELLPRFDHLLINSNLQSDKYMKLYYLEEWNWPLIQEILQRTKETDVNIL